MKLGPKSLFICLFSTTFLLSCNNTQSPVSGEGENQCVLSDGRTLSYMEYGPADGFPLLYFHGFPGSHKDVLLFKGKELAEDLHLRLIAINRPGYEYSGSKAGRSPFALACAYEIPDRIHRLGIVSGMGPWDAPESKKGMAMTIPRAPKLILKGMAKMLEKKPTKMEANMKKNMPEVDQEILELHGMSEIMLGTIKEGLKNGTQGALEDARIYKQAWGMDLGSIRKTVFLWHGEEDLNVKIETAKFIADQLGHCEPTFFKEEGHLSLIVNHAEKILKSLSEQ